MDDFISCCERVLERSSGLIADLWFSPPKCFFSECPRSRSSFLDTSVPTTSFAKLHICLRPSVFGHCARMNLKTNISWGYRKRLKRSTMKRTIANLDTAMNEWNIHGGSYSHLILQSNLDDNRVRFTKLQLLQIYETANKQNSPFPFSVKQKKSE